MYEKFKSQFILRLSDHFDSDEINAIIHELNIVVSDYDIIKKERSLVVFNEIPEAVKVFIACKKIEGYADGTLNNYKNLLLNFFRYVNKPIEKIETNDIRLFLYFYQNERKISSRTINKYQDNLKAFFAWCFDEGYINKEVAKKLKPIKYEIKPREALSQMDLEKVRNACKDTRERAIVEFIYSTGCRVSELCAVMKDDIDWNDRSVHLFGKGMKHRTSFLNAKAEYYLKKYMEEREDDNEYLFVSERKPHNPLHKCGIEKIFRELSERAELDKKLTPHILRHTTATTGLNNGMPIDEIQKMLGHSSINTTMIYAKTSLENVRNNHKRFIV